LLNLQDVQSVCEVFERGATACRVAACRRGSIDRIEAPGTVICTGDLHDNPVHFEKLVQVAGMDGADAGGEAKAVSHLVLHEIIHPDRLVNGMDLSFRALAKVADLKARFPEHVHVLLGNHELAQLTNANIMKDGVKNVDAFKAGLQYAFGEEWTKVEAALHGFIRAMPLALSCETPRGRMLCAHSLPPPAMMQRFDPGILSRELTDDDYEPRRGGAYLMTWGRGYDAELLEDLVERWGVNLFILGHEKVDEGARFIPPCAVVLNSDHARGVYLPIDLSNPPRGEDAVKMAVAFAGG
jgi:Calcineurin-like phosphoesterase